MKHTQGNWYIQFMHKDDPESDFWVKSDINPKVNYGTDIMSDDYGDHNGYPREQRLADAKLISAAPDLLEIFIKMTDYIQGMDSNHNVIIRMPLELSERVGVAIKKATILLTKN